MSNGKPTDPMFYLCQKCGEGWVTIYGLECWTCRVTPTLKVTPRRSSLLHWSVVFVVVAALGFTLMYFWPEVLKL